jgi:hypothetical protein
MNTEQTKTLGQLAYENDSTSSDAKNTYQWGDEHPLCHARYERMAQAVATEVLNRLPGEWVLLHEEEIIEIGDEKYSVGMWAPVSVNVLGKMVGGRIVRRRLSPVPSQQPQLGSSKEPESCPACNSLVGWLFAQNPDKTLNKARSECHSCGYTMDHVTPPPAPRAEWKPKFKVGDRVRVEGFQTTFTVEYLPHDSKDAYRMVGGYNAKEDELTAAPWKLPEPPEGMQWHRTDWTQDMLPEGYRPLLLGEYAAINADEFASYPNGVWLAVKATGRSVPGQLHTRTRRHLPAPSTPQPEEIPYEETDLFHARKALLDEGMRANTLMQERDAALARASEAEKQLADIQREFGRIQGTSAKSVVDRFLDLMRKLNEKDLPAGFESWESFLKYIDGIKARAVAAESELATARASVPVWVPCHERMPTEKDAPSMHVFVADPLLRFYRTQHIHMIDPEYKFWMSIPPLPVETEEGRDMVQIQAEFEEWAEANGYHVAKAPEHSEYFNIYTAKMWDSWQAALRSKKPS